MKTLGNIMKKILLVDDSVTLRMSLKEPLEKEGFEVIEAEDGVDGLKSLDENPDTKLVISDVNMPNMDGLEMVEKIKAIEKYKFIPILMLTTEGAAAVKQKGIELGVKAWAIKPIKAQKIISAAKKLAK
jgi:two-component system chemotaxis response regulator CheY